MDINIFRFHLKMCSTQDLYLAIILSAKCWRPLHYIWCLPGYRICYFAHLSIHSYYEDGLWSHSDINVSLALLKCILCLKYFYIVSGQWFPIWGPEVNNDTWSTGLDKIILNNFLSCLRLVKQKCSILGLSYLYFHIFAQMSLPCHSFLEDLLFQWALLNEMELTRSKIFICDFYFNLYKWVK